MFIEFSNRAMLSLLIGLVVFREIFMKWNSNLITVIRCFLKKYYEKSLICTQVHFRHHQMTK